MGSRTIVLVGNGMVGWRLCERLAELGVSRRDRVVVFGEERHAAYDRVHLTSYLGGASAADLLLAPATWYASAGIELRSGERVTALDATARRVESDGGSWLDYDVAVLCTGSVPFVPPPFVHAPLDGCFVYRTLDDLDAIRTRAAGARQAVVIGGGLLGLEAAKALVDMGIHTHVLERAPRLMPRQLDARGAALLEKSIRALGVEVHVSAVISGVERAGDGWRLELEGGEHVEADLVVVSAGIVPRDELARGAGLQVGGRGGVVVDDELASSDPHVFAVGEVACHRGIVYGLVGPGYAMADVLARRLAGEQARFGGADCSAKLKLLGVDVASVGEAPAADARSVVYDDFAGGIYQRLDFDADRRLLGAVLVGDASPFARLVDRLRSAAPIAGRPEELLFGAAAPAGLAGDDARVCTCNDVGAGAIRCAIRDGASTLAALKKTTKAGTGCGGCLPQVGDLLQKELLARGQKVSHALCEHFEWSRQELFHLAQLHRLRTFADVIREHGRGAGCEICKPAVASILASLWNEHVLEHATIQDTNDRYLANIQKGGLYSVIPRIPGGEITAEKLGALASIAKRYGLYVKITGGQRIDLLGARLGALPDIWEDLVAAGFESGHAYGKAMRTVKSCVGSTWCRFGVQDSVGFAIRVEHRYKGVRAPHKLKSAVSGCVRECAEAQSKDFGLIATEKGWNLYVCGNGGSKPRHADLLATDLDEEAALRYVDRFLAFYIRTADRLTRTSVWLDRMQGGIEYLRDVIVKDSLGVCAELEAHMQKLVDGYECEWKATVENPEKWQRFREFVNTRAEDESVQMVMERGQRRPRDRSEEPAPESERRRVHLRVVANEWVPVGAVEDFPPDGGAAVRHGARKIAVFRFASRGEWFATDHACPHTDAGVLARGILGDCDGTPKVACPMHKKSFSLRDGSCLSGEPYRVTTYPVRVENGLVFVELPIERRDEDAERRAS